MNITVGDKNWFLLIKLIIVWLSTLLNKSVTGLSNHKCYQQAMLWLC